MEFGIHLVQQNTTIGECRELWRWADTAGFTWVDVSDHFYESPMTEKRGPYLECLSSLTALAIDTENVRVGTCVLAMDYRHPAVLANALATIDHLADGRLDAGLGAGWNVQEYSAYGIPFDRIGKRLDRLEEGIQVLRALWEEPEANYSGEHYQLTDALCEPKPLQPRVPIWIGGVGETANAAAGGPLRRRLERAPISRSRIGSDSQVCWMNGANGWIGIRRRSSAMSTSRFTLLRTNRPVQEHRRILRKSSVRRATPFASAGRSSESRRRRSTSSGPMPMPVLIGSTSR